jgi:AcrR family transcriptional regulator
MSRLTRDDIVIAAGRRFATYGYHGTSMRDLGDDLGILGSSIYAHVGGKHELLVSVVERAGDLFTESADKAIAPGGGPVEVLGRLIRGHIDVLVEYGAEANTFLNEAAFLDQPDRERVTKARDGYEAVFRSTIQDGIDTGAFRVDLDAKLAGIYVLSMLNAIRRWYRSDGRVSRDELAADMHRFIIEGLT